MHAAKSKKITDLKLKFTFNKSDSKEYKLHTDKNNMSKATNKKNKIKSIDQENSFEGKSLETDASS